METVWRALEHTPWWVFVVLFCIALLGVRTLETRVATVQQLAIAPALFAAWAAYSLVRYFGIEPLWILIFVAAVAIGSAFGWLLSRRGEVRKVGDGQVEISGSPINLAVVAILFVFKYLLGVWISRVPGANQTFEFLLVDAVVTGIAIGIFLGRFAGIFQRYRSSKQ